MGSNIIDQVIKKCRKSYNYAENLSHKINEILNECRNLHGDTEKLSCKVIEAHISEHFFLEQLGQESINQVNQELVRDIFASGIKLSKQNIAELEVLCKQQDKERYLKKLLANGARKSSVSSNQNTRQKSINDLLEEILSRLNVATKDELNNVNWVRAKLFCDGIYKMAKPRIGK